VSEVTSQSLGGAHGGALESFVCDLRYAGRRLRNNWGFTALAVVTLALGIGATTAVFSVVNGVLLQPLPYPESDRLVAIAEGNPKGGEMLVASGNFADMRRQSDLFDGMAAYESDASTVLGGREPVRTQVASVSADFFALLRVRPVLGRQFTREEMMTQGAHTAVVSFGFWRNQLGNAANINERSINVDGVSLQVVGVMPQGFSFPDSADVWMPRSFEGATVRSGHQWNVVGRLKPGADIGHARAELAIIYGRLKAQYGAKGPATSQYDDRLTATSFTVQSLHDKLVGSVQRPLLLLLAAAAVVLLVACTNVASTLLAAGAACRGGLAIRAALGATRTRVIRQLSTEGILLAALGAAAGVALAAAMLRALIALAPAAALPRIGEIRLDGRAIVLALLAGVIAAILSSILPALRTSRLSIGSELVTRGDIGGRGGIWSVLVGTEVALALLLLLGAGLLAKSFSKVLAIDPGFTSEGVLTAQIALPESAYPDNASVAAFYQTLVPQLSAISGVQDVGITHDIPLSGRTMQGALEVEGRGPQSGYATYDVANEGYFKAVGIQLKRGRLFDESDHAGAPDAVIVSEAFAERYWPGQDPIGKRLRDFANDNGWYPDRWATVVGVVANVQSKSMTEPAPPATYVNPIQRPFRARDAYLTIRSTLPPAVLTAEVRARLKQLSGDRIPAEFETMDSRVSKSVAGRRFSTTVLGFFAAVALILAAIGIYSVVSYQVVQRTREMGIRMALGAQSGQVLSLVVKGSMRVVALGLLIGMLAAPALTRVLQSLLFGVSAADIGTFITVLLLFVGVALIASLIPARRATRVDPILALRSE
jgi:putative ABC transport system permease protein